MRILTLLLAASLVVVASGAHAIEFKPYPSAAVSASQWEDYFSKVKASFGASRQELSEHQLILFKDNATATTYAFTKPGHPAHPAWVTRRIVQEGSRMYVDQVGYFAGQEAPFARLFQQYQETNKRMIEAMKRESGSK
jgi:hypothetical protein